MEFIDILVPVYFSLINGTHSIPCSKFCVGLVRFSIPLIQVLKVNLLKSILNWSLAEYLRQKSNAWKMVWFLSFNPTVKNSVVCGTNISHHNWPLLIVTFKSTSWIRSDLDVINVPCGEIFTWALFFLTNFKYNRLLLLLDSDPILLRG